MHIHMHKSRTSPQPQAPTDMYSYKNTDNKTRKRYYKSRRHSSWGLTIHTWIPGFRKLKCEGLKFKVSPVTPSVVRVSRKANPNNHMPIILMALETEVIKTRASQIHELEKSLTLGEGSECAQNTLYTLIKILFVKT